MESVMNKEILTRIKHQRVFLCIQTNDSCDIGHVWPIKFYWWINRLQNMWLQGCFLEEVAKPC